MARLRIPDLQYIRNAKHQNNIQLQRKADELVLKGNFNQPIYIDRNNGNYKFQSSTRGKFVLNISDLREDWPEFPTKSMVELYVRQWCAYAVSWLKSHGHSDVEIKIVRGFVQPGQFSSSDTQHSIRQQITAGFLSQGKINRSYFENSGDVIGSKG